MTTLSLRQSIVDPAYIKNAIKLVDGFKPWTDEMIALRTAMSTRPEDLMGDSKRSFTGLAMTRLEAETARTTEMVSGKLYNMVMNFVGRMINGRLIIAAADVSDDPAEQRLRENLVAACDGIIAELDIRAHEEQRGSSWRWQVALSGALTGKQCGLPWIRRNKAGKAVVTCEMWDPLTVAHDFGGPPKRYVHWFSLSRGQARAWLAQQWVKGQPEFTMPDNKGKETDEDVVTLHDVWVIEPKTNDPDAVEVRRGILVDGECVGVMLMPFDYDPIEISVTHATIFSFAAASGATGQADMRGMTYEAIRDHCATFFQSLKTTQVQWRAAMSRIFKGLSEALKSTYLIRSADGTVESPPGGIGGIDEWSVSDKDEVRVELINRAIAEMSGASRIVIEQFEKAFGEVYNLVLMGQSADNDSGFKDYNKVSHAITVLNEPAAGAAGFVAGCLRKYLRQLQSDPTLVLVAQPRSKSKGGFAARQASRVRDFTAKDFPEDPRLDVTWSPNLGDWMQKLAAAQQESALGLPMDSIWADELNITNVQELREQAAKLKALADPQIAMSDTLQVYMDKWLEASAEADAATDPRQKKVLAIVADYLRREYEDRAAAMKGPPPGQGTPKGAPGLAPQFSPPEMNPSTNPDELSKALGLQSSAAGGQGSHQPGQGGGRTQTTIRNGVPINKTVGVP